MQDENYNQFLRNKMKIIQPSGFNVELQDLNNNLFDWQKAVAQWAIRKGKCALFLDTGLGKTIIQLVWANEVCKHTGKNVLILAPLTVSKQTQKEGTKFGIEVNICRSQADVKSGINIANYEMLEHFNADEFIGVVLDECFPSDTLIDIIHDGKLAKRKISDIVVGDKIINAKGVDEIVETHKRRINRAVYVNIGGRRITCSENHPFLTVQGWKSAQYLQCGDCLVSTETAMRLVRNNISAEILRNEESNILRQVLLSEMENVTERYNSKSTHERNSCDNRAESEYLEKLWNSNSFERVRTNSQIKSNAKCRNEKKSFADVTEDESQTYRAWGKWNGIDEVPSLFNVTSFKRMDSGISYITGKTAKGLSDLLQSRYRKPASENSNRGGRIIAQSSESSGKGLEENSETGIVRVDSVEILEQSDTRLDEYRNENGDIYFYDLKAKQHPSFSIDGILVHNSSILKSYMGITKQNIIKSFSNTPYRLSCTATPSPNNQMEILNQAEYLGVMKSCEALAIWFINDMKTGNWRLKGHAVKSFWEWVSSWAVCMSLPSDIGYSDDGYILPPLNEREIIIPISQMADDFMEDGFLRKIETNATAFHKEKRITAERRAMKCAEIVNKDTEQYLIWCNTDYEADLLKKHSPNAIEVRGSNKPEFKEQCTIDFMNGSIRVLISKAKIFGYGLNFQNCHNTVFCGIDYSYENYYQAVRRFWRFGQKNEVNAYIVIGSTEQQILKAIREKEQRQLEMKGNMNSSILEVQLSNFHNSKKLNNRIDNEIKLPLWLRKVKENG